MPKSDTQKLTCSACNHENEIERVYCHNCGEKLDRSLLPKIEETVPEEDQKKVRKKVKKMMNPNRLSFLFTLRRFVQIVLLAAAAAAVILVCRAPEGTPPRTSEVGAILGGLWSDMISNRLSTHQTFKQSDLNHYLETSLKGGESSLGIKFERAFVILKPDEITVTEERNAWGLPLYTSITFKPVMKDGKWSGEILNCRFGRLGIHPSLQKLADGKLAEMTLAGVKKALKKEMKDIDRMQTIEAGDGTITFVTKPAQ